MENDKNILVMYHGECPDGFGSAYAAWKKFGNDATYIPLSRNEEPPVERARGKEVYFIDFCYEQEIMNQFMKAAAKLVMLDHHVGVKEVIESIPEHRYGTDTSGSGLAWEYFHPGTKLPLLLQYVQEGDLYRFALPHCHEILSYVYTREYSFEEWDRLAAELETPEGFARIIETGRMYSEHALIVGNQIVKSAKLIEFEGYTCYLASCSRQFGSYVGHQLAEKLPPIALVASVKPDGIAISIRSDGTVDVSKIAQKYGGNGHAAASGFRIKWDQPIPWTPVLNNEDSSD